MKKLIAIMLAAVMVLALAACGTINKTEVSILWSGAGEVQTPNSLINAMERAMYIENIAYQHYGAQGDQDQQIRQAQNALDMGCAGLMVELVDPAAAQDVIDMAKSKDVPVVFFNCAVEASVISGYAKCALVTTDETTLHRTYNQMVNDYVADNANKDGSNKLDLDGDGKINYVVFGDIAVEAAESMQLVQVTPEQLNKTVVSVEEKTLFGTKTAEHGWLTTNDGTVVELILEGNDTQTLQTLVTLQAMDMNTDKLATHFVPVFTVGAEADYKAYVLSGLPQGDTAEYLNQMRHLVDLTAIDESEWAEKVDAMIYNTLNQCDAGKLIDTVVEDYDAVATAAAATAASYLKGNAVSQQLTKIPYISYKG